MSNLTDQERIELQGKFVLMRCKSGDFSLKSFGGFTFKELVEVDLCDPSLPGTIRCATYWVAKQITTYPKSELAQAIAAGELVVVEEKKPDPNSALRIAGVIQ